MPRPTRSLPSSKRNAVFVTWNALHMARMLEDSGGISAYGNSTGDWNLEAAEHTNPEHR